MIYLEIFFHISGAHFIAQQDSINQILKDDAEKIKILTVGDSTTDESFAIESGVLSWPKQLQEILNLDGYKVRVYNKATSGINSYFIVEQIAEHIEIYKPDIVIAMMGINDNSKFGRYQPEWHDKIKFVKLIKNYYKYFFVQQTRDNILEDFISNNEAVLNKIYNQTVRDNLNLIEVKRLIGNHFSLESDKFYFKVALIERLLFSTEQVKKYKDLVSDLIASSTESKFISPQLVFSALHFYNISNAPEKCLNFATKISSEYKYVFYREEMSRALSCYDNLTPEMRQKHKSFFTEQTNSINLKFSDNASADNYAYLNNFLRKKNIKLVVVGYPSRSVELLKMQLNSTDISSVIFVSNEKNFAASLDRSEYNKYFIDRFAGTFGHATTMGNRLIAEEVAKILKPTLQK